MSPARTPRRPFVHRVRASLTQDGGWRTLLSALRRNQVFRIVVAVIVVWVLGATGIHLAERGGNPPFDTWIESFWNVWILLFAGPDEAPRTAIGRLIAMALVGLGVGLAGLFTGSVASILVAENLRRRDVSNFEMEDHLVLCNWSERGLPWIREVHSKIIQDKRPVVIIHDSPEAIDLPDKQDDAAFNDVYIVKGDPSNEVILRRARVPRAHSVVVLADDRQGEHADARRSSPASRSATSARATSSRTSPSSATTSTTATTCSGRGPTRSSLPTSWASGSWPGPPCSTG